MIIKIKNLLLEEARKQFPQANSSSVAIEGSQIYFEIDNIVWRRYGFCLASNGLAILNDAHYLRDFVKNTFKHKPLI